MYLLMMYGYILPANYSDAVAKAEAEAMEDTDDLYAHLEQLPGFVHYLVYDTDRNVIQTNMSEAQRDDGLSYLESGMKFGNGIDLFLHSFYFNK